MPKILVVDDEPNLVNQVQDLLEQEGWEVTAAGDGCAALEKAQDVLAGRPDLIVLDIMMPVMSGMECLRQLGYHRASRSIPVVILTQVTTHMCVTQARELGARDYITKPFDPERLVAVIRRILQLPTRPHQRPELCQ